MSLCRAEEPELVLRVMEISPALCVVRAGLNYGVSVGVLGCWSPRASEKAQSKLLFWEGNFQSPPCSTPLEPTVISTQINESVQCDVTSSGKAGTAQPCVHAHVETLQGARGDWGGEGVRPVLKFTPSLEKGRALFEVSLLKYIMEKMIRIEMSAILDSKLHPNRNIFRIVFFRQQYKSSLLPQDGAHYVLQLPRRVCCPAHSHGRHSRCRYLSRAATSVFLADPEHPSPRPSPRPDLLPQHSGEVLCGSSRPPPAGSAALPSHRGAGLQICLFLSALAKGRCINKAGEAGSVAALALLEEE